MSETLNPFEKSLADYLNTRKILIADSSSTTRSGLAKILTNLGAKSKNLILSDGYANAKQSVQTEEPQIIIADNSWGENTGIDLSMETRTYKNKTERLFILLTTDTSQSIVAEAAEEDVDIFILKPYSVKGFTEIFCRAVALKINPSDFSKAILAGKALLEANDLGGAYSQFSRAIPLSEKPALAYYYCAQVNMLKKSFSEAETNFMDGLKLNNLHYMCLNGLFELLSNQKRTVDAYRVIKQISRFYPANSKRLGQLLSLAISTGNYTDIEQYYESFKNLETRDETLIRCICASLVVCGKYFFRHNQNDKALDLLRKARVSAASNPSILREIITVLVDYKMLTEAEEVLKRFPDNLRSNQHFVVSSFLVNNLAEPEKIKLIPHLRNLVRENIKEPVIWYWLIFYLVDCKKTDEAETICETACAAWPDKVPYFKEALKIQDEEVNPKIT